MWMSQDVGAFTSNPVWSFPTLKINLEVAGKTYIN
jgi:hypothetical protein